MQSVFPNIFIWFCHQLINSSIDHIFIHICKVIINITAWCLFPSLFLRFLAVLFLLFFRFFTFCILSFFFSVFSFTILSTEEPVIIFLLSFFRSHILLLSH